MPDSSPKMGLVLPSQVDPFSTEDIRQNWEKVDSSPGTYICTSGTRPTWTAAQAGRKIFETNTGLEWWWDGTAFKRTAASGLLKRNDGSFAISERTTDFTTTSANWVIVSSLTNVVVPAGNRPIRVEVAWNQSDNNTNPFSMAIFRSNTANSGPVMGTWLAVLDAGATYAVYERNGLSAGTHSFSFQIRTPSGGTAHILASSTTPVSMYVTEL